MAKLEFIDPKAWNWYIPTEVRHLMSITDQMLAWYDVHVDNIFSKVKQDSDKNIDFTEYKDIVLNLTVGSPEGILIKCTENKDCVDRDSFYPFPTIELSITTKNLPEESWVIPCHVLFSKPNSKHQYQGYIHTFVSKECEIVNTYYGITKRQWLKRINEHRCLQESGAGYLFHRYWKEFNFIHIEGSVQHHLVTFVDSLEKIMDWEEQCVDKFSLAPLGLNMIPGGYEGLKFMQKFTGKVDICKIKTLEDRHWAFTRFLRDHPLAGLPKPWVSDCWANQDFYEKYITNRKNTLSPDEVNEIRRLHALNTTPEEILKRSSARNTLQIKRLIAGETYRRVN